MTRAILVADSVTALTAVHGGQVVVTGSHGGRIAAVYAARAQVRAIVFNDAGGGLDDAGTAGLAALDSIGVAAIAVFHTSARIGDGSDTLACGVVSHVNCAAAACKAMPGMSCEEAARKLLAAPRRRGTLPVAIDARTLLLATEAEAAPVRGLDSIGLVEEGDAGSVLVIGSHGALHGGDPRSALGVAAQAAFFHDAGRGKQDAGVTRLPVLAARGMPAAAVDYRTARIGDARSMWATGMLSVVNDVARMLGIVPGMALADAAVRLRVEGPN